jgi:hypothetical protein
MQTEAIYEPAYRLDDLERLDFLDWDEVHDAVQLVLRSLDEPVGRLSTGCHAVAGRNSARAWQLFSYRTFKPLAGSEIDPIVVGITFSVGSRGAVQIRGDISGETLGDVLFDVPPSEVMGRLSILEKARDISEKLTEHAAQVAEALRNSNRQA